MLEILIWLGRNSLVIMAVHFFFIRLCCYYLEPLLYHSVYKITEQFMVWSFCLLAVWFVNRYVKWVIGK